MTINHFSSISLFVNKFFFYFARSFTAEFLFFDVRMTQEILKWDIGNDKSLGIASYNIYFKNNFNLLVVNVKQIIFFTDKITYINYIIREVCSCSSAHININLQITTIKHKLKWQYMVI